MFYVKRVTTSIPIRQKSMKKSLKKNDPSDFQAVVTGGTLGREGLCLEGMGGID